ncbi:MAG: inositol monophosphatase [Thalassobaculales bacterium]
MSSPALARLPVAQAVAVEAGHLMRRRFLDRDRIAYEFKGPQDYLTAVDGEVERLVRGRLAEAFPEDGFIGEEDGGSAAAWTWVVDPIDGTANFARGIGHFCISIALLGPQGIEVGVICQPVAGELMYAGRGTGAFLNGEPMRVSQTSAMVRASVELGWSPRRPAAAYLDLVGRVMATGAAFRRAGSGALGIADVAAGRSDGYAELHINAWDCLAGILLVREAGGWTNDFLAGNGLAAGNPIIACAPGIQAAFLAAVGPGGLAQEGRLH